MHSLSGLRQDVDFEWWIGNLYRGSDRDLLLLSELLHARTEAYKQDIQPWTEATAAQIQSRSTNMWTTAFTGISL